MIEGGRDHVLVVGITTRALAASAASAGYRVTAVDPFGDLDLRAVADVISPPRAGGREFRALAAADIGAAVSADFVTYTSNLENHPEAVIRLEGTARLLGNSAHVLARVRNPIEVSRVLRQHHVPAPVTRASAPSPGTAITWMLKPRRSGGGHGVTPWRAGMTVPRSRYLQQRISGIPGSVVFVATGGDAVVLGLSRQIVGDPRFGVRGFRYCGNILACHSNRLFPHQEQLETGVDHLARVVAREFGLVGLNGIDFVAHHGVPYPIEINPRYSASMELIERAHGLSLFETHANAFQGQLPDTPSAPASVHGKAVVFARRNLVMGDTRPWVGRGAYADIPHPWERIARGRPICTVLAKASTGSTCMRLLVRRAASVYRGTRPVTQWAA
jgi:uncharacterized protein